VSALPAGLPTRARKDVAKYVLDDEDVVLATRRHWAVLIEPVLKFLPFFVLGGWLFLRDPQNRFTSTVGLLVLLGALGYLALRLAEWWMRHFIVTRRRVLLTSGVIVRTVTLLPLRRITDLTWQETLLGQFLNYGTFRFESAGQDQALRRLTFLPDAQSAYHVVSRLLFGADYGAAAAGDDEGNPEPPPPPSGRPPSAPPAAGPSGRHDTEPIPRLPRR